MPSYRTALPATAPGPVRASLTGVITDPAWLAAARHAFAHGATVAFVACAALLALVAPSPRCSTGPHRTTRKPTTRSKTAGNPKRHDQIIGFSSIGSARRNSGVAQLIFSVSRICQHAAQPAQRSATER
jgi:hypothetical protein